MTKDDVKVCKIYTHYKYAEMLIVLVPKAKLIYWLMILIQGRIHLKVEFVGIKCEFYCESCGDDRRRLEGLWYTG
jgi:hypothetical protein